MDQNQTNEPVVDVADLAAQVAQSAQSNPPAPQGDGGEVDEAQLASFNEQLAKFTGGKVNSLDVVKEALSYRQKYEEVAPKFQELQSKAAVDPFANDLAKTVNNMFAEGKDRSFVKKYVDLHFMDIDSMDGLDIIAREMEMGKIPYTAEQIKYQLNNKYPMPKKEDFEDDEAGYNNALNNRKMQIDIDAKASAVNLQSMMSDMGDGKIEQQQQEESERRAALVNGWSQVGASLSQSASTIKFTMDDAKRIGGAYSFEFKPKNVDHDLISQVLANQAAEAGLPLTKESIPKLQDMHQSILWNLYRDEYLEAMASDMYASLQEHFVRSKSSSGPPKTPAPVPKKKPTPGGKFPRAKRGSSGI